MAEVILKKLHNPMLLGAIEVLKEVFLSFNATDMALDRTFKSHKKWGSRDRKTVAELIYFSLRNFSNFVTESELHNYQNINFELLVKKSAHRLGYKTDLAPLDFPLEKDPLVLPPWFLALLKENKEDPEKIIFPQWIQGKVYFRLNPGRTNKWQLENKLKNEKLSFTDVNILPDGFLLKRNEVKIALKSLIGLGEIQDGASQLLCRELPLQKEMTVLDVCAGAGGKALYLSELLDKKNSILVHDTSAKKLGELEKRFIRNNRPYRIIKTSELDQFKNKADLVLVDTPCSGLGVLKRNPETLWQMTPEKLRLVCNMQIELLKKYCELVKPGGYMAYMTCSVLKVENDNQIAIFLNSDSRFKLLKEIKIYDNPNAKISLEYFDGMYLAILAKI